METTLTSWITLAGLGAFHGLNPGMGWLFAVALGMQEGKRSAVWRALIPLTLGHGLAIAAAIGVAMIAGIALSPAMLRWPVAILLAGLGIRQLHRHLHPRWAAMRVGMGGLTLWSFLMASAHGAGLMVLPVFLSMTAAAEGPSCHARGASRGARVPRQPRPQLRPGRPRVRTDVARGRDLVDLALDLFRQGGARGGEGSPVDELHGGTRGGSAGAPPPPGAPDR